MKSKRKKRIKKKEKCIICEWKKKKEKQFTTERIIELGTKKNVKGKKRMKEIKKKEKNAWLVNERKRRKNNSRLKET